MRLATPLAGAALAAALLLAQGPIEPRRKPPAPGKGGPTGSERTATLRADTQLVLVPVSVNDALNRTVSGLERENFRIYDNGVEQTITQFSTEDEPVAIGFIFDTSGSMSGALGSSRMAAKEFCRTANPEDEYLLVEFDTNPRLAVPLTRNPGEIDQQLLFSKSKGSTALFDAIYLGLHELRRAQARKRALLVLSDGGDNHSRYTAGELQRLLRETDVFIYAVAIFGRNADDGSYVLNKIAESTGGRLFFAGRSELPDIALKVGIELRNRYVIGFAPNNLARDGKYHRIQLKVLPPKGLPRLFAHWRTGYYAPLD